MHDRIIPDSCVWVKTQVVTSSVKFACVCVRVCGVCSYLNIAILFSVGQNKCLCGNSFIYCVMIIQSCNLSPVCGPVLVTLATVTRHAGGLNRHWFSHSSEAQRFKIKVPTRLVSVRLLFLTCRCRLLAASSRGLLSVLTHRVLFLGGDWSYWIRAPGS